MSQILSQVPRLGMKQEQRLTAQLIQAMDILQLNAMALESRISQEIDGNPALEYAPEDDTHPVDTPEEIDANERPEGETAMAIEDGDAKDFERLDNLVTEYDWIDDEAEYRGTKSRERVMEEGDSKLDAMANTAARPIGLQEFLLQQWHLVDVDEDIRQIGERIIDHLDDGGRLTTSLDDIADRIEPKPTTESMALALDEIQMLEPAGIAARDLTECLLLQLQAMPGDNSLECSIVRDYLDDLRRNRLPQIAKALSVDLEDVKGAREVISSLTLHPGYEVVSRQAPAIMPDVIVTYNESDDTYDVRLTRDNTRQLRISPEFRAAMKLARTDKAAREFVKQKLDAANAIIDAVRYRSDRLLDVAKAVVAAQRDFFDKGEQHIKVLRMSDLAERFGCDPSTISRTVDEKYMETPRGMFPLRRFFTGGAATGDGEEIGWDSIRAKVQEIIDAEDKAKPMNDDEIVEALSKAGIEIKRRTVAKYRSQLNIPTARQRRQY